jgi:hypothetical protein
MERRARYISTKGEGLEDRVEGEERGQVGVGRTILEYAETIPNR